MISKLIIATRNQNKIKEIRSVLNNLQIQLLSLNEFPEIPEVIEDGLTFEENARKKAVTIYQTTGIAALADDSGLEVDFLNGAPGVFSKRFAGENATDAENNEKLLKLMAQVADEKRTARFRCVMVFVDGEREEVFDGKCDGKILHSPAGKNGFGYDPLFYFPELRQSFAEIEMNIKNQISHRGRALQQFRTFMNI